MKYNKKLEEYIPEDDDSVYMDYIPGHRDFSKYTDADLFCETVLEMFETESFVPAYKLIMELHKLFKEDLNPSLMTLIDSTGLAEGSKKNKRSAFYSTGYACKATKRFHNYFRIQYFKTAIKNWNDKTKTADSVFEFEFANEIRAGKTLEYETAAVSIRSSPSVEFIVPDDAVPSVAVDKVSKYVQYIVVSNHGTVNQMPYTISYAYICPRCKMVTQHIRPGSGKFCGCGGKLITCEEHDRIINSYVYSLAVGELDAVVISLKELPVGECMVAMYMLKEYTRNKYYGFVLGYVERDILANALDFSGDNRHALFPIIEHIEQKILEADNQIIPGMGIPKGALVFSMFQNICGDTTLNCMLAGKASTHKTRLMKYIMPVMSRTARFQDVVNTSIPGVMGTGKSTTINGQVVDSIQRGLYTTVEVLMFDELYSRKALYTDCKTVMLQDIVPKAVANAVFRTPKTATTIGTANVDKLHLKFRINRLRELTRMAQMDPFKFCGLSEYADDLYHSYNLRQMSKEDYEHVAMCVYLEECKTYEINYIDGYDIAESDRFPFLFYIKGGKNNSVYRPHKAGALQFNDLLYSSSLRAYLEKCSLISVVASEEMIQLISKYVVEEAVTYNFCQSEDRINLTAQKIATMSAALNGRYCVNEVDVLLVRDIMRCTGRYVSVDEFDFPSYWSKAVTVEDAIEYLKRPLPTDVFTCTFEVPKEEESKPKELKPEVTYMSYVPKRQTMPFTEAPNDVSQGGIISYLLREMTECEYVTDHDLEYLAEQHSVDSGRIKLAINSLCEGNMIAKDSKVNGYKAC